MQSGRNGIGASIMILNIGVIVFFVWVMATAGREAVTKAYNSARKKVVALKATERITKAYSRERKCMHAMMGTTPPSTRSAL